jgi:CDGSH-type Zn-finger protein
MTDQHQINPGIPRIVMTPNGSYHVYGNVPLVHKTQVVSEYGEPLTWVKDGAYAPKPKEGQDYYRLCRCGHSKDKPYCDGSHHDAGFDGAQTADTRPTAERQVVHTEGTGLIVKRDEYICADSGFCANRLTDIVRMLGQSSEPRVRAEIIGMIGRCPSGSYTYAMGPDEADIEPDLPVQIAVTTEITSDGPIEGPLWVTGGIPIERSDGQPFETRNRVTLCNCGLSARKPLCDGSHRAARQAELRQAKEQAG